MVRCGRGRGGEAGEAQLLTSCYRASLLTVVEAGARSIAFPAISTGIYGYPMDLAASSSLETVRLFLIEYQAPALVRFVLFGEGAYGAFARVLESMAE